MARPCASAALGASAIAGPRVAASGPVYRAIGAAAVSSSASCRRRAAAPPPLGERRRAPPSSAGHLFGAPRSAAAGSARPAPLAAAAAAGEALAAGEAGKSEEEPSAPPGEGASSSSSASSSSASSSPPPPPLTAREAVLSYLRRVGWHRHYATPIAAAAAARAPKDALARVRSSVAWLASRGFSSPQAETMAVVCKELLTSDRATLQGAWEWLGERGLDEAGRRKLLVAEPSLLAYAVSKDGKVLERGKARALVVVQGGGEEGGERPHDSQEGGERPHDSQEGGERPHDSQEGGERPHDSQEVRVFQWRDGATFGSTPVSSQAPPL